MGINGSRVRFRLEFANSLLFRYTSMAKQLRNAIAKLESKAGEKLDAVTYASTPEPKVESYLFDSSSVRTADQIEMQVPKNIFSPSLTLDDVDEEEIARQLTLIEYEVHVAH